MRQDGFRTQRARELRREMTPTEKLLWSRLRGGRFEGFKFRRQTPIAGYIVDFYCPSARLIVELDGESHIGRAAADQNRQGVLESHGFKVLCFWDTDVYDDLDVVLEMVWQACSVRSRPLTPGP